MNAEQFVMEGVMTVVSALAKRGIEVTIEKTKEIIQSICQNNPNLGGQIDIDQIAEKIQTTSGQLGRVAYNEETLARFLEVPLADVSTLEPDSLDMSVLYDHVRLESEFQGWLEEWGYSVEIGSTLVGLNGIEYRPDVYGRLTTLHGEYEVCVNFVCDRPPSEFRVLALLQNIEAYAEDKEEFSHGDLFAIVTPHSRFTDGAAKQVVLQNEQEDYLVFTLEGGDVFELEKSASARERLMEFRDRVVDAEAQSRRRARRRQDNAGDDR